MRGVLSLLIVSLAGCAPTLELEVASQSAAITGGTPESGYPAVFALAYDGTGGCTGTCIAPRIGLTAAHCLEGTEGEALSGLFGDTETSATQTIDITAHESHPSADIAVVAFAQDCPAVIPFNRTALEDHVDEPVVMVGFGITTEEANDPGIKRSGTATLFSVSPAEVSGMLTGELATSNTPAGTCNGDSGGPTFMTIDGVEVVVGVTSRGSINDATGIEWPCGQGRSIAVRADSYADLIDNFSAMHGSGAPVEPGSDAGPGPDPMTGVDAGSAPGVEPTQDAGGPMVMDPMTMNPMTMAPSDEGGCQCRTGSGSPLQGGLLLLALVALRRRR